MHANVERQNSARSGPFIRCPQSLVGGLLLIGLAGLALWLAKDLAQGSLQAVGPGLLPRWLAYGVGLSGFALLAFAFIKDGQALERWTLRGPFFVIAAIVAFAVTIRSFSFGSFSSPTLGLVVAGPLSIVIAGFATSEARLRELVILGLTLTPFCMLLFGDMLNLPIPLFPQALLERAPAEWSQKAILRVAALAMLVAAFGVFAAGRKDRALATDGGI